MSRKRNTVGRTYSLDEEQSGAAAAFPNKRSGEVYAGDPDIETFAKQDLRYGGEDFSSVSEWSMRARNLELDDGLDNGDFVRSDTEILMEVFDACEELGLRSRGIDFEISGA